MSEKVKELNENNNDSRLKKKPVVDIGVIVDDTKEIVEKTADMVGEAAEVTTKFAEEQIKIAKKIFDRIKNEFGDEVSRRNIEKYRPIFREIIDENKLIYPKMINVVDNDKRMKIEECKGAVGYQDNIKNTEILGIYKKDIDMFNEIEFYPDKIPSASVYYVHPINPNQYIEITEYFKYLKEQRVTELEYIAQELGAKYFKVQILEETMATSVKKTKAKGKIAKIGVDVNKDEKTKEFEFVGIAAENRYPGKDPTEPVLKLWANNESIKSLVKQRLSNKNPLQSKTFRLDYNTASGIKLSEAAKIDAVLKGLKSNVSGSIQEEAKKESKRKFEYTIEF